MNRIFPDFVILPLGLLLLIVFASHLEASTFDSAAEFNAHSAKAESCTVTECHGSLSKMPVVHSPVVNNDCITCHRAERYPFRYGLVDDTPDLCLSCHGSLAVRIADSKYVHGPVKSGDCSSCHDPHASKEPFILKRPYGKLCVTCHKVKGLFRGGVIHKPVRDGNCGLCHDPHASDLPSRLTGQGANLCIECHEEMVPNLSSGSVHEPLLSQGCTSCHDPHSGNEILRLKLKPDILCFSCHKDKANEVQQYTVKHKPALDGRCTSCHNPHYSGVRNLLKDRVDNLCVQCHRESTEWASRRFRHGPVIQGNCTACHNPHGSDNPFILKLFFPHRFYASFEAGKYELCFACHKQALVSRESAKNATRFRNGELNLHWLHVNRKKGRTCRACHDVHASNQEGRIRDEFPYGGASIPIFYSKSPTGGTCTPGCHREKKYDRLKSIRN
jgi:predicted CXXCH cytochrome family protein